jgi:hypothetical protein
MTIEPFNEALARHLDPLAWQDQDRMPDREYSGCQYSITVARMLEPWLERNPDPSRVQIARCFGERAWARFDQLVRMGFETYDRAYQGEDKGHYLIGFSLRRADRVLAYLASKKTAKAAA